MWKFFKSLLLLIVLFALIFILFSSRVSVSRGLSSIREKTHEFFKENSDKRRILELESENQKLTAELSLLGKRSELSLDEKYEYKIAEVYSRYPFNDESLVMINLGSDDGIKAGMPVFVEKGILLGKVRKVNHTQSEVETIFNSLWEISVSVGAEKNKAVYKGGTPPSLDLIPKEAQIYEGDLIVSSDPNLPLGSILGSISEVSSASYDIWKKAKVSSLFSLEGFRTVFVMIDFP